MKDINPAIDDMIAQKKISDRKVERLRYLKKLVDKVAARPYLPNSEVDKIEAKFGVKPDVITWGDYFQTHIASEHWEKSDDEFDLIIDTIHFDLIASVMIFTGKSESFHQEIEETFLVISAQESAANPDDEEIMHLHILKTYFKEMGLRLSAFENSDFDFFRQYSEVRAVS
ncbi:MAG: hypothetical protein OEV66_00295 [Spirochaetia bacterium]|nr:hypothetical protein [Spirochaetia bacterium]